MDIAMAVHGNPAGRRIEVRFSGATADLANRDDLVRSVFFGAGGETVLQ